MERFDGWLGASRESNERIERCFEVDKRVSAGRALDESLHAIGVERVDVFAQGQGEIEEWVDESAFFEGGRSHGRCEDEIVECGKRELETPDVAARRA